MRLRVKVAVVMLIDMKNHDHNPESVKQLSSVNNMDETVEDDISEIPQVTVVPNENGVVMVINHSKILPPFSVVWATVLYCAEFICASVLSSMYHKSNDVIWMGLTITFILVPSVLTQLTLTFVHRDLGRDRPFMLFMHLLQMGPIMR